MNPCSYLNYKNIYFVPTFHNRLQFVLEVRKAFSEITPDIVVVELPDIYYSEVIKAVDMLPSLSMLCIENSKQALEYIPIFPSDSIIEGIRLARENKLPIAFIDVAIKDYKIIEALDPPDDYAIKTLGLNKFYDLIKEYSKKIETPEDDIREKSMAFQLNRLNKNFKKILFIGGMSHWENIKNHIENNTCQFYPHEFELMKTPFLAAPSKKSLYALLEEMPYLVFHYELARRFNLPFDKWDYILKLLQEVKNQPFFEDENYSSREFQNLLDYLKKLAYTSNKILPDLFNLLLASKQTLGDDFSLEVLELALSYKFENKEGLRVIDFDDENFLLDGKKIKLKRKIPFYGSDAKNNSAWKELKLVKKKKDDIPDDYINEWFFFGFYSHLPEDKILEGFIDRTGDKLVSELLQEPKIQEFTGNLFDGLALKDTIKSFHNKKIYVKEYRKDKIDIGSWLIVFDDELTFEKYPWEMALAGEVHNESDLAFYATNPFLHPLSKEIVRAEYGALLAFKPALPNKDKINAEDLEVFESGRINRLFSLAIHFSQTKDILYIANKPPENLYTEYAKQKGKRIFYLPINRFSNRNLKKLKRFHLLRSKETRNIADDYI